MSDCNGDERNVPQEPTNGNPEKSTQKRPEAEATDPPRFLGRGRVAREGLRVNPWGLGAMIGSRSCPTCRKATDEPWCWECDAATIRATEKRIKPTNNGEDMPIDPGPMGAARLEYQLQCEALMASKLAEQARLLQIKGLWSGESLDSRTEQIEGLGMVNKWHAARARGMVSKWERIMRCVEGKAAIVSRCGCEVIMQGCGHRECPRCRPIQAKRQQKKIRRARIALRSQAKAARVDRRIRERFMTITVPSYKGPDAAVKRVQVLFDAWKGFADWLRRYMRERCVSQKEVDLTHSWRMFEWTEGRTDGMGHPHFHVWLHCPWLNQTDVAEAWARALENATGESHRLIEPSDGTEKEEEGYRVLRPDIRLARGDIERELVKYMLKDFSDVARFELVSPVVASKVMLEMMGRRRQQTSRGLSGFCSRAAIARDETRACPECGEVHSAALYWEFRLVQPDIPVPAEVRGPPS